jgi:uncharacterized membrane protein (DUF441 family)
MLEVVVDFIRTSRKAIVAFVITALIAYVARKGYSLDANAQEILRTLLDGVIAGVLVWLTKNKQ